jgi:hypothetical protein
VVCPCEAGKTPNNSKIWCQLVGTISKKIDVKIGATSFGRSFPASTHRVQQASAGLNLALSAGNPKPSETTSTGFKPPPQKTSFVVSDTL